VGAPVFPTHAAREAPGDRRGPDAEEAREQEGRAEKMNTTIVVAIPLLALLTAACFALRECKAQAEYWQD